MHKESTLRALGLLCYIWAAFDSEATLLHVYRHRNCINNEYRLKVSHLAILSCRREENYFSYLAAG